MAREMSDQLREAINQSSFGTDDVKQARQSVTAEETATLHRKIAQKRGTPMTDTIEVPISLIQAGDMDAIRELLPKPNLFGRWATHPHIGRGIIISEHPDQDDFVQFASGESWQGVPLNDLTLDPETLTTVEDFENAPAGTIVANGGRSPYVKRVPGNWEDTFNGVHSAVKLAGISLKVLRWGWGD